MTVEEGHSIIGNLLVFSYVPPIIYLLLLFIIYYLLFIIIYLWVKNLRVSILGKGRVRLGLQLGLRLQLGLGLGLGLEVKIFMRVEEGPRIIGTLLVFPNLPPNLI